MKLIKLTIYNAESKKYSTIYLKDLNKFLKTFESLNSDSEKLTKKVYSLIEDYKSFYDVILLTVDENLLNATIIDGNKNLALIDVFDSVFK